MSDLNDPRVFFAAERTLLAWTRSSLALLAFGFVIERFALLQVLFAANQGMVAERDFSYLIGLIFMLLGSVSAVASVLQYRKVLRTLKPIEIPQDYSAISGVFINMTVATLGILLIVFICLGTI